MFYQLSFTLALMFDLAVIDVYNKRRLPLKLFLPVFITALMLSTNLLYGFISFVICIGLGIALSNSGVGFGDSLEIGIICLITPILISKYSIPLIIPLWIITLLIGSIFTVIYYKKGNQPLTIAIALARLILLI